MPSRRTHVLLAQDLVEEIDRLVGKRRRSEFLAAAAALELRRRRQVEALRRAAGAWHDRDHPELRQGGRRFVGRLREESDRRLGRPRSRGRP